MPPSAAVIKQNCDLSAIIASAPQSTTNYREQTLPITLPQESFAPLTLPL